MTRYETVEAKADHIDAIARNCRQEDVNEVWAAGMVTVRTALEMSLEGANIAQTWLIDGTPAAMGGINGPYEQGVIWLIGTDLIDKHRREFLAASRKAFDAANGDYDYLANFIDVRNRRGIKWLRYLGFQLSEPMPFGPMGKPFQMFWWARPQPVEITYDSLVG